MLSVMPERGAQRQVAERPPAADGGGLSGAAAAELIEQAAAAAQRAARGSGGAGWAGWLLGRWSRGGEPSVPEAVARMGMALPRMGPEAFEAAWAVGVGGPGESGWWPVLGARWLASAEAAERAAGLCIATRLGDPALAGAVALGMTGADPAGDELAERALERMAVSAERHGGEGVAVVGGAVLSALERVERHRRGGLARLAARLWSAGGAAPAWLGDADHPGQLVLRAAFRRDGDPALAAAAWAWLKHGPVRAGALPRVLAQPWTSRRAAEEEQASGTAQRRGVLECWHLVHHPARRLALSGAPGGGGGGGARRGAVPGGRPALLSVQGLAARGPAQRRAYAEWIGAVPLPAAARDAAWGAMLADADAGVRHAVLRAAVASGRAGGGPRPAVLLDLCFDAHPAVAHSAASVLLAATGGEAIPAAQRAELAGRLSRSPHAGVRGLARGALRAGPARASLPRELGGLITGDHAADARRLSELKGPALRGAIAPGLARELAEFVAQGVGRSGEAAWPVAAAVTVLGAMPADQADRHSDGPGAGAGGGVLALAARAADARVRANAVDAMVRRARGLACRLGAGAEPAVRSVLLAASDDPSHRVRGAAARGLLLLPSEPGRPEQSRAGRRVLAELLHAGDARARVAGLWVAGRLADVVAGSPELVDRARYIEMSATDPAERSRSAATVGRLMEALRGQWADRARQGEPGRPSFGAAALGRWEGVSPGAVPTGPSPAVAARSA